MSEINITLENFEREVVQSDVPVMVDFWATWCGPCRMIAPIVESIAAERDDVLVGKIDVDQEMELAVKFGIVSIPTLIVMKNGEVAAKHVGYCSKEAVLALLEK